MQNPISSWTLRYASGDMALLADEYRRKKDSSWTEEGKCHIMYASKKRELKKCMQVVKRFLQTMTRKFDRETKVFRKASIGKLG